MSDLDRLLREVIASPGDDAPRLAYADACVACDPERAEFIRLSCRLARTEEPHERDPALLERKKELIAANRVRWSDEVLPDEEFLAHHFRRGFAEVLSLGSSNTIEQVEQAFARTPILTLDLWPDEQEGAPDPLLRAVRDRPFLQRLRELSLLEADLLTDSLVHLLDSPHLRGLGKLTLGDSFDEEHAAALGRAADLPRVEHLSWIGYIGGMGDEGLKDLLCSPLIERVQRLDLGGHGLGAESGRTFAACPHLQRLRSLTLGASGYANNELGEEGLLALARAEWFATLEHLAVAFEQPGQAAGEITERGTALRKLHLPYSKLATEELRALTRGAAWGGLRSLSLECVEIGDAGAEVLAEARSLPPRLHLRGAEIGFRGVERLARTGAEFELVDLRQNPIEDSKWRYLAHNAYVPRANLLAISGPDMADFEIAEVARHVRRLDVHGLPGGKRIVRSGL